jgi:hypothetical protein
MTRLYRADLLQVSSRLFFQGAPRDNWNSHKHSSLGFSVCLRWLRTDSNIVPAHELNGLGEIYPAHLSQPLLVADEGFGPASWANGSTRAASWASKTSGSGARTWPCTWGGQMTWAAHGPQKLPLGDVLWRSVSGDVNRAVSVYAGHRATQRR